MIMEEIDYCATCKHYDCEPHFEPCVSCRIQYNGEPTKYNANPKTNADRIRAMSDEELAEWLAKTQCENVKEALQIAGFPYKVKRGIIDGVAKEALEWLKQPAEE